MDLDHASLFFTSLSLNSTAMESTIDESQVSAPSYCFRDECT
jgi:hypothetical protein